MGRPFIFESTAEDFGNTGLCGSLTPISCEHEEIAGGMSSITMVHPYDSLGKWKYLEVGRILQCDVRVRTAPAIDDDDLVITTVEKWTVKTTLTTAQRKTFKSQKGNKKGSSLIPGREAYVLQKVTYTKSGQQVTRWQIKFEKQKKKKRNQETQYVWVTGWVEDPETVLDHKIEDVSTPGGDIESICPSIDTQPQLFRILSVEKDADAGQITVYAVHISYDLQYNVCRYVNDLTLSGRDCLQGIMDNLGFETDIECYTNIGSTRTSAEYVNVSPIEALLDPDTGFLPRWKAELVRDDMELYFVSRAGRSNGMRIEYGKNLTGITYEVSEEDVYTAVLPLGVNKDGTVLYMADNDNPSSQSNYVISENAPMYPFTRVKVLECKDATVEKGKKGVSLEVARARMQEQAEELFDSDNDERIDVPKITATVNFIELGETMLHREYRGLENVFLYDTVVVADAPHGIEIEAKVQSVKWDCLNERLLEVELSNTANATGNVYSWQLPTITGEQLDPLLLAGTPSVNIYGGALTVPADADGVCEAESKDYTIIALVGGDRVTPTLGTPTGVPQGMAVTIGDPDSQTRAVTVSVSVAEGAELAQAGTVTIPCTSPLEAPLYITWVVVKQGQDGTDGTDGEDGKPAPVDMEIYHYTVLDVNPVSTMTEGGIDYTETPVQNDSAKPSTWDTERAGLDKSLRKYEWMSKRTKDSEGIWGVYSVPVKIGEIGLSSASVESDTGNIMLTADSAGALTEAFSKTVSISASIGGAAIVPQILSVSGLPSGMSYSISGTTVTLTAASGAVVGGSGNRSGLITVQVRYTEDDGSSATTNVGITWAKICAAADGAQTYRQNTQPTGANAGDIWYSTNDSTVSRYNGSSWEYLYFSADYINAGTIAANRMSANVISAINLSSSQISADRIDVGNLTVKKIINPDDTSTYLIMQRTQKHLPSSTSSAIDTFSGLDIYYGNNKYGYIGSHNGNGSSMRDTILLSGEGKDVTLCMFNGNASGSPTFSPAISGAYGVSNMVLTFDNSHGFNTYSGYYIPTIITGGNLRPGALNAMTIDDPINSLGNKTYRWYKLYAQNSNDVSSDRRLKTDIAPLAALDLIKSLKPKRFHRINDPDEKLHFGFIAQDVRDGIRNTEYENIDFYSGSFDDREDGPMLGLCYEELIAPLVEGWQEHERIISDQQRTIDDLTARIERLEALLTDRGDSTND